ncbi:MAG: outer membrane beta-barrel protein [Candidatus Cyclobacteriaceae bacterium M2_1C_046]
MKPIAILFFCCFSFWSYSQDQSDADNDEEVTVCTQNLRQARSLYEEGKLNEIPSTLSACLKSGFTPEEKVEAYRLIAITDLYLDNPAKADEAMLNLLHTNPEYVVNENIDPAEYINLYRSFRTKWLFRWGIKGGGNYSIPHVMESFSPTNPGEYSGQLSYQIGALMEFDELIPHVIIQPEVLFTSKSYGYSSIPDSYEPKNSGELPGPGNRNLEAALNLGYLELFITGKYQIWKDKKYYALLSPGVGYLVTAEIPSLELDNAESPSIDLLEDAPGFLHRVNPQLFIGAGTEFKFGRFYALADIRYGYSFSNLINDPFAASQLQYTYGLGASNHKLNSVIFSISFIRATYKPKKLTD